MKIPIIFVALDCSDEFEAENIISRLTPEFCGIKIGKEIFTALGPKIVDYVHNKGFKVFLDLKFHDIPNTVKKACHNASNLGVYMINVHALGGTEMMLSAKEGVYMSNNTPTLIGVTILTSHNQKNLYDIGFEKKIGNQIGLLAKNVAKCKLDGVVCSASDLEMLKPILPKRFHFITPGIRLESSNKDDQERITTPLKAKNMGSTSLVIGRPITEAKNPLTILQKIYTQIN